MIIEIHRGGTKKKARPVSARRQTRGGLQRADDFAMARSGEIPILSPMMLNSIFDFKHTRLPETRLTFFQRQSRLSTNNLVRFSRISSVDKKKNQKKMILGTKFLEYGAKFPVKCPVEITPLAQIAANRD
jgi:hypothetical protein